MVYSVLLFDIVLFKHFVQVDITIKHYHHKRCHAWPTRGGHVAEQCHAAGVIFVFACSWIKVAQIDKFRGHFFAFASSWAKVAHADKFRGLFFAFASSWTKVA